MEDVKDILDLCKLNLMEESIKNVTETCTASSQEVQNFKYAIKFGKQKVANRIINNQKPASDEILARNQEIYIDDLKHLSEEMR